MAENKTYSDKLKDPRWQKKRLEIMHRDSFQCQMCFDRDSTLTVHHKYYLKQYEPWDYNNKCLITLCEDCHESVHLWEKNFKMFPERYAVIPAFTNITDLRVLIERIKMIESSEGDLTISTITKLLTAYIIDLKDL